MKNLFFIILEVLIFTTNYGQYDSNMARIFSNPPLYTKIKILLPTDSDDKFVYEEYQNSKVYWLVKQDTLIKIDSLTYKSNSISINTKRYGYIKPCDSLINYIRNSYSFRKSSYELRATASRDIGNNNKEFESRISEKLPSREVLFTYCNEDYVPLINQWVEYQFNLIQEIKKKKEQRFEYIKNSKSIDTGYIKSFLSDFDACLPDYQSFVELINKDAEKFMQVIDNLSDIDFFAIKRNLSDLPEEINSVKAILELKNVKIKSRRKRILIRKLRKNI